jgi:hypothetical protein
MWALVGDLKATGIPTKIVWEDGEISGQPEGVAAMQQYADLYPEVLVLPTGPSMPSDLTNEESAYCIALALLFDFQLVAGSYPAFAWLPEDEPGWVY